jgi:hypothetical protein
MTNLQIVCSFINLHPPAVENYRTDMFNVPFSHRCDRTIWLFCVSDTGPVISQRFNPPEHCLVWQNAVAIFCKWSVTNFNTYHTFRPLTVCSCSVRTVTGKWNNHVNIAGGTRQLNRYGQLMCQYITKEIQGFRLCTRSAVGRIERKYMWSKAVPLHAMKVPEERGGIAPTHSWAE